MFRTNCSERVFIVLDGKTKRIGTQDLHFADFGQLVAEPFESNCCLRFAFGPEESDTLRQKPQREDVLSQPLSTLSQ